MGFFTRLFLGKTFSEKEINKQSKQWLSETENKTLVNNVSGNNVQIGNVVNGHMAGRDLVIRNNRVWIDGKEVTDTAKPDKDGILKVVLVGNAAKVESDVAVVVEGNVEGDVTGGNSVSCGNVKGNVKAGNSVNCGRVGGNCKAGNSINQG